MNTSHLSLMSGTLPPMSPAPDAISYRGDSPISGMAGEDQLPYSDAILPLYLMGGSGGKIKEGDDAAQKLLEHTLEHKFIRPLFETAPPESQITDMIQTCLSKMKKHTYKEPTVLATAGKPGKCIYFILEGEAYVMAEEKFVERDEDKMIIKIIHKGDYFGEVSCLYNIPCTATVKTSKWTIVQELRGDDLLKMLVNKEVGHITEWFIARRYMPTQSELVQFDVQEGITTAYLDNLPMFRGWEEMPVKTVVRTLPAAPVILYLPDTPIIFEHDPGGELILMINGRADIYDGPTKLCTVFAKDYPFIFGEEGLFNWEYTHRLAVVAQSPCHVIHIPRLIIDRVCIDMSEYAAGADVLWRDTNVMWRDVLKARDRALYQKYNCRLQIEMLYRELRESEVLMTCDPGLIYMLAINGLAQEYNPKQQGIIFDGLSDVASTMVFVVEGQLELSLKNGANKTILLTYDKGSIFHKQSGMSPKAALAATMPTLVLVLRSEIIKHLMSKWPQANLNLNQGSQFSVANVQ